MKGEILQENTVCPKCGESEMLISEMKKSIGGTCYACQHWYIRGKKESLIRWYLKVKRGRVNGHRQAI